MRSNNRSRASASVLSRIALSHSLALSFCSWFMNEPVYLVRLVAAVRAGHRRASESRLAPALSSPEPLSSLPPPHLRFRGVAGGVLHPCIRAFKSTNQKPSHPRPFPTKNDAPPLTSNNLPPLKKSCPTIPRPLYLWIRNILTGRTLNKHHDPWFTQASRPV